MSKKVKLVMELSSTAAEHAVEVVEFHSDEGTSATPFPPSNYWEEIQSALADARGKYEKI